jgi:hypothetical protein
MTEKDDLRILRVYCDKLGLGDKTTITMSDLTQLRDLLRQNNEMGLALYIEGLKTPNGLEDLLVNQVYD